MFPECFRLHKYDTATKRKGRCYKNVLSFRLHKYDTATKQAMHLPT